MDALNLSQLAPTLAPSLAQLDMTQALALAAALGWASGVRLYLAVFVAGLAGQMGWVGLPEGLAVLQHPAVLGVSGFMLAVEFLADKVPLIDSAWDAVHTFIRIPAGAALAAAALGADSATMAWVGALLGGSLAATSHATKMTTRAAVNTSPEPFSNIAVSLAEDGLVLGAMWLATQHPVAFGLALGVVLLLSVLLLVWLARLLRAVLRGLRQRWGRAGVPQAQGAHDAGGAA